MIDIKKPVTMLEYLKGEKKLNTKRIDFLKGNQDNIWKESDKKATKAELTQAREDMEAQIADKADASDITTINETLAGKAEQSEVDSLASEVADKASQADLLALSDEVDAKASQTEVNAIGDDLDDLDLALAGKASQADLDTLTTEVGTKASQSALNSLATTVDTKASQADLNTATGRIGTLETESATKDEVQEVEIRTISRGSNLVTNGNATLGNNYNFSMLTYDGNQAPVGSAGSFKADDYVSFISDEFVSVDITKRVILSLYHKFIAIDTMNTPELLLPSLAFYDVDKNLILAANVIYRDGSTTTLAQDLHTGDTEVVLTDASGWGVNNNYANDAIMVWNYINSYGYQYPPEVYTRRYIRSFNAINGNTLTLANPYTGSTIEAGTAVSQSAFATNTFIPEEGGSAVSPTEEWTLSKFVFPVAGKGISRVTLPLATAYMKIKMLINYHKSSGRPNAGLISSTYISGVKLEEIVDPEDFKDGSLSQSKVTNLTADVSALQSDLASKASNSALSTAVADLSSDIAEKASNEDLGATNANVTALQTSKADKTALNTLSDEVANKASISALARTTNMDIYSNANLQSFVIGPAYSTATAFCTEIGLFLEIKTPVWLSQSKIFMKDADNVLVQIYNYENDVVIYEESFSLGANENIISLGVLLPAGRYYFSGTSDNESLAYFPTTEYSITHHFVSVFGGELDPVAFPAFMPGTTNQWAGFYQMTFLVPYKALYLGFLPAKEPNANLIKGAFYHVNDSNYLRTWCFDGTTQISN